MEPDRISEESLARRSGSQVIGASITTLSR